MLTCSTCDRKIRPGEVYRIGRVPLADAFRELLRAPVVAPGFTLTPFGEVRFDLCAECVALSPTLERRTSPATASR